MSKMDEVFEEGVSELKDMINESVEKFIEEAVNEAKDAKYGKKKVKEEDEADSDEDNDDEDLDENEDSDEDSDEDSEDDEDEVKESFGLGVALIAAGGVWAWLRNLINTAEKDIALKEFLKQYDKESVIMEKFPAMTRRFKLVSSLSDLNAMERDVDRYVKFVRTLPRSVDKFVDSMSDEKTTGDKIFLRNPANTKREIKRYLNSFVKEAEKNFTQEIDRMTNELLA